MDYQLRYEKESLYYMPVQHVPCEWCIKDPSTKEEIEKMLTSIDLTCKLDKTLAWMYHHLVHISTSEGRRFLLLADSEKLVWLCQLAQCLDDDRSHGPRIKKMVVEIMTQRYLSFFNCKVNDIYLN